MDEINWFHSIPLDDGTVTPGLDSSMDKLEQVCLPKDLSGKTVLTSVHGMVLLLSKL